MAGDCESGVPAELLFGISIRSETPRSILPDSLSVASGKLECFYTHSRVKRSTYAGEKHSEAMNFVNEPCSVMQF